MVQAVAQLGYQMCAVLDQSQGWTNVIMVDGEKHHGAITVSMMRQFNVKVCFSLYIIVMLIIIIINLIQEIFLHLHHHKLNHLHAQRCTTRLSQAVRH